PARRAGRARAGAVACPAGRARQPVLHRDGDARGLRERRRCVPGAGGDAPAGGGGLRAAVATRPGRRLRAAGGDRHGRIRAGVPRARPGTRARRGDQSPPPVAHGRCRRGGAVPPRGPARGAAAAPEERLGGRVDQRADLYSLAATSYFALLGRPPFEGRTPEAILARQTTDDVPPLTDARHDVPRELEEVLRRALSSDPGARFQT